MAALAQSCDGAAGRALGRAASAVLALAREAGVSYAHGEVLRAFKTSLPPPAGALLVKVLHGTTVVLSQAACETGAPSADSLAVALTGARLPCFDAVRASWAAALLVAADRLLDTLRLDTAASVLSSPGHRAPASLAGWSPHSADAGDDASVHVAALFGLLDELSALVLVRVQDLAVAFADVGWVSLHADPTEVALTFFEWDPLGLAASAWLSAVVASLDVAAVTCGVPAVLTASGGTGGASAPSASFMGGWRLGVEPLGDSPAWRSLVDFAVRTSPLPGLTFVCPDPVPAHVGAPSGGDRTPPVFAVARAHSHSS